MAPEDHGGNTTGRDSAGRFRPGFSGNTRGRPKGRGIAELLGPRRVRDLALHLFKLAKGGDTRACEILASRIWPGLSASATKLEANVTGAEQHAVAVAEQLDTETLRALDELAEQLRTGALPPIPVARPREDLH